MARRLISLRDGAVLLGLILLCTVLFWVFSRGEQGAVAVVNQGNEELLRQELTALQEEVSFDFDGADGHHVTVVLSPEGARIAAADCPDQVCVRTGALTLAGEVSICLPARISLRLEGPGGTDAVTW